MSEWQTAISRSTGKRYFFNKETHVSQWEKPEGVEITIKCSHILLKHKESRRPSSWRQQEITRTKEEAIEKLKELRYLITTKNVDFGHLAKAVSDCRSHDQSGSLGEFGRGEMQKPFEDAAFALAIGELSEIVDTESGVHLILRTG
ncbi:hypothetical protein SNEBB_000662 [Seison nebaliae]|nr:hypothetical protein SNEBB_000662 [Seison nebaliae]